MCRNVSDWWEAGCTVERRGLIAIIAQQTFPNIVTFYPKVTISVTIEARCWYWIHFLGFIPFCHFSHELISHSGFESMSKCEHYTKHFYVLLTFSSHPNNLELLTLKKKWRWSYFPSLSFPMFMKEELWVISHSYCLQHNTWSQLLG